MRRGCLGRLPLPLAAHLCSRAPGIGPLFCCLPGIAGRAHLDNRIASGSCTLLAYGVSQYVRGSVCDRASSI